MPKDFNLWSQRQRFSNPTRLVLHFVLSRTCTLPDVAVCKSLQEDYHQLCRPQMSSWQNAVEVYKSCIDYPALFIQIFSRFLEDIIDTVRTGEWLLSWMFFPKDVSSQGSSEDCWRISHHTYLTPHISYTYPSHHTYPTHIHSKRIPPIRIPPMCIHSKRLHQQVCNTYPSNTYPFNTYPTNTYPCYAYPFKRCASAGIVNVSHQYISHQYVSSTRIPPVRILCVSIQCVSIQKVCISRNRKRIPPIHIPPIRIFNTYPTSTDPFNAYPFKKFASAGMAMSMSITANHFIPLLLGGNGNEYKNFAFPSILCKIIN